MTGLLTVGDLNPVRPGAPADASIHVRMPRSLIDAIEHLAEREGRSRGSIVRRLLVAAIEARL